MKQMAVYACEYVCVFKYVAICLRICVGNIVYAYECTWECVSLVCTWQVFAYASASRVTINIKNN